MSVMQKIYRNKIDNTVEIKQKNDFSNELKEKQQRIKLLESQCLHKDKMLAALAHDIRGPIASIAAMVSIFEYTDDDPEIATALTTLKHQVGNVNNLLNNMLLWSSRSFNNVCPDTIEPVDIFPCIKENLELLDISLKQKNINTINKIDKSVFIKANKDQVNFVLRNIISNAVKFTHINGEILLEYKEHKHSVAITIADSGIGMTLNQIHTLFTSEHKSTYGTEKEKGFGLGLLLSKEYIEANEGTMAIKSKVDKGTAITISFPSAN